MSKSKRDRDYDLDSRHARLAKQAEKQERNEKRFGNRIFEQDSIDDDLEEKEEILQDGDGDEQDESERGV